MRGRAIAVGAVLTLVLSAATSVNISAAVAADSKEDRQQISELAQSYLQQRADRLTNRPLKSAGFVLATTPDLAARLQDDAGKLDGRRVRLQDIDGGFSHAEVSSSVEKADFAADGRRVVVRVVERTNLYFQVAEPNSPQYNGYQLRHTLAFDSGETGWVLAAVEAEIPPNTPAPATQFASSLPPVKAVSAKARSSVEVKAGSSNRKVTGSAYDYYAIADYANRYVWNPNPDYRVYSQDCTNFLSQAMKAGGWQPVDGDRTWDGAWYYGNWTWTTSYTWAGAENWYWFATYQTQRTWILPYVYDLGFADVLQLDFQQDNIIDHSMIVTAVNTVDVHLTYHSGPEHNKRLQHILEQYPNAWYYAHRT